MATWGWLQNESIYINSPVLKLYSINNHGHGKENVFGLSTPANYPVHDNCLGVDFLYNSPISIGSSVKLA